MKNKFVQIGFLVLLFASVILVSLAPESAKKLIFGNRAAANELTVKIKLQGEYDKITNPVFKTKLKVYTQAGLAKEYTDLDLTKDNQNIFKFVVNTESLPTSQMYAFFIKPDKYLGKLFCSPFSYGVNCTTPQITISSGSNTLDLTQDVIFSGDITTQDGKVAADDISKIMSQVGQESTSYIATDINSNFRVQTVDYSLALYSLSKNYVDDAIPFTGGGTTPTPTSATPTTSNPTPTTSTPTSAPTSAPTPTTAAGGGGTCRATVNGKIYVNAMGSSYCSPLNNEQAEKCVNSATECTEAACKDEVIVESKAATSKCGGMYGATLDEAKSRATLTCTVQFVSGTCVPTPAPTIDCNQDDGGSC